MFDPNLLCKYKDGFGAYTELRAHNNGGGTLTCVNGSFTENPNLTYRAGRGISARVFEKGAFGFASLPACDEAAILSVLKTARENARILGARVKTPAPDFPRQENGVMPIKRPFRYLSLKEQTDFMTEVEKNCKGKYADIKHMDITVDMAFSEKMLAVSNGFDSHSLETIMSVQVTLSKEGPGAALLTSGPDVFYSIHYLDALVDDPAPLYDYIEKQYQSIGPQKKPNENEDLTDAKGGMFDCILSPTFTAMLAHEAVGHTMEADAMLDKASAGVKYMGKQVASPLVSLTDFANTAYGKLLPIQNFVDDEGILCMDAVIIKDGVLTGAMTNRASARELGLDLTGNARASGYMDAPIVRMRNTCFLPGQSSLEDMIASVERGYYLTRSSGGNGDMTGKFNMGVDEGYEIVGGKVGKPIKKTIVTGTAWEALSTVDMVSDGFKVDDRPGSCGKSDQSLPTISGGPAFKLKLKIGGS